MLKLKFTSNLVPCLNRLLLCERPLCSHATLSNEETFLQDFLENLEEMFPRYHMHSNICKRLKSVFKRVIYVLMSIRISSCKATRLPI